MKKLRIRNLIYPTNDEDVFIHIYPDPRASAIIISRLNRW